MKKMIQEDIPSFIRVLFAISRRSIGPIARPFP